MPENATVITRINNVTLSATEEKIFFGGGRLSVEWGKFHEYAEHFRNFCRSFEQYKEIATIGYLFECSWGVSNHWLWKNTNDSIVSSRTLEELSEMKYTYDYNMATSIEVQAVKPLYNLVKESREIQDNIIEGRNQRLGDDSLVSNVQRLEPEHYDGTIKIEDVLFDEEDEEYFLDISSDMKWLDNPLEYIEQTFENCHTRDDSTVVTPDSTGKPVVKCLSHIISMDKRYSHCFSKVVETAPYRDDIQLSFETDYDSGNVMIEIQT